MLVGHTHFDHAVDAPAVARRFGCRAYGSSSLAHLMGLHGLAELAVEVEPYRPYELGPFVVTFVPSAHSKLLLGLKVPYAGELTCDHLDGLCPSAYKCGAGLGHPHRGRRDQPLPPGQRRADRRRGPPPRRRRLPRRDRRAQLHAAATGSGSCRGSTRASSSRPTTTTSSARSTTTGAGQPAQSSASSRARSPPSAPTPASRRCRDWPPADRNFLTVRVVVGSIGRDFKPITERYSRMNRSRWLARGIARAVRTVAVAVPGAALAKKKPKTLDVCKHGCKYRTIQEAVDDDRARTTTIKVKPGKYIEGVVVERPQVRRPDDQGHEEEPQEGRSSRARTPRTRTASRANNGIEGDRRRRPDGQEHVGRATTPPTASSSRLRATSTTRSTARTT